jgi:hypothetical protein
MGGTSSSQQSTNQESQVTPYGPAAAGLTGILGNLMPSVDAINGTPQTNQAFSRLEQAAGAGNPFADQIGKVANSQMAGGANYDAATGLLGQAYGDLRSQLSPYTGGSAMDAASNPALAQQLATVNQQVSDTVNPMFAGLGRLGSPDNAKAMAMGIAQGATPLLQNAAANQLNAISALYGAGGTTAQGYGNLDANNAAIRSQGVNNANTAYGALTAGPQLLLQTALAQQANPLQIAGLLSPIFGGLGAQFGQTKGNSATTGTNTMSGAQQFGTIAQGIGHLMPKFTVSV